MTGPTAEDLPNVSVRGQSMRTCIVCGDTSNTLKLEVPGDPLGKPHNQTFLYFQCGSCKSLRLAETPEDMSPYYSAETYYSFQGGAKNGFRGLLQRMRDRGAVFGRPWPLQKLARQWPDVRVSQLLQLSDGNLGFHLTKSTRILDVGCGSGAWLKRLAAIGFSNLTGADPFLKNTGVHDGVSLIDKPVENLDGEYDLIVCSHALEHVKLPMRTLSEMRHHLADGGMVMIRIPLSESIAWYMYGGSWVQLDAPRHLTLFSAEGFRTFSKAAGFEVVHVEYDSGPFMVLGSIARQRGILPHNTRPEDATVLSEIYEKHGADAYKIARQANVEGNADQATFFLSHT